MNRCAISGGKGRTATLTGGFRSEEARGLDRRLEPEVGVGALGRDAAARSPLEQAALEQVGLVDVLDRVALLPHGDRERGETDLPAGEVRADRGEDLAVETVQALVVDLEEVERGARGVGVDVSTSMDLGKVAHALEQAIGHTRGAAAALGDRARPRGLDLDPEHAGGADDDPGEVAGPVVLEPVLE